MPRPMRNRRGRNTDPEPPRRGIAYSIEPRDDGSWRWTCLHCISGCGSSPWLPDAHSAASTHYRNAHEGLT